MCAFIDLVGILTGRVAWACRVLGPRDFLRVWSLSFLPAVARSQSRPKSKAPCKPQLSWHAARQGRAKGAVGQDVTQDRRVAVHIGSGREWQREEAGSKGTGCGK